MPYDITLSSNTGMEVGGGLLLLDWLGIGLEVVSICFHLHNLSFLGFIFLSLWFGVFFLPHFLTIFKNSYYPFLIIKLFLSQPTSFFLTFMLLILPHPTSVGGSKRVVALCLIASQG